MARKRDAVETSWARDRLLQFEADQLVNATESVIIARAAELGCDPRTLRAYVDGARSRKR